MWHIVQSTEGFDIYFDDEYLCTKYTWDDAVSSMKALKEERNENKNR